MALVLAYGILSKFVPDVLLRALADAGDVEPPPFPEKSAGAELMQNTFGLYGACCASTTLRNDCTASGHEYRRKSFSSLGNSAIVKQVSVRSHGTRPAMKIRIMSSGCSTRPSMTSM